MRRLSLALILALPIVYACSGDDDKMVVNTPDSGVDRDSGVQGPDADGDQWTDDVDNCPADANPEQRDRDGDGIGDACDTCPATPNDGLDGRPGQDQCVPVEESEPNNLEGMGEPITLEPTGMIREVRGTIEENMSPGQSFDRFKVMVAARTLLEVRVARTRSESLLEPYIAIQGGAFTRPRVADGLFVAKRQVYIAEAGTYEIAVADRRGVIDLEPRGNSEYGYALSIRALPITETNLTLPVEKRPFEFERGNVGIFSASLDAAMFTRIATETDRGRLVTLDGVDTILFVELDDGATVYESDDIAEGYSDSRVVLELTEPKVARIVLDHAVIRGDELEVRLIADQPEINGELEPNDREDLATEIVVPGDVDARINAPIDITRGPPDVDWYTFVATPGQVLRFFALPAPTTSIDPAMLLGKIHENGEFETLYTNFDSSGVSPEFDAVLPDAERYHLLIVHEGNLGDPDAFQGGELFAYFLHSENIFRPVVGGTFNSTTAQTLSGEINPGGTLRRHFIQTTAPSVVCLEADNAPDLTPYLRVYGPNHIGNLGEGSERALAYLPANERYIVAVNNGDDGIGGAGFTYDLTSTIIPVTGVDEVEPNGGDGQPTPLAGPVAAAVGSLETATDVDIYSYPIAGPTTLHVVLGEGSFGRQVQVRNGNNGVLVTEFGAAWDLDVTEPGLYTIRISSDISGPYTLVVKEE